MALPTIDTAYKPDGALGALFSGFNAANADQSAELELIKQALANQREQSMQPLDTRVRQMEAARADVAASPEMLDAYARGYIGQNNSQDAAGRKAMETVKGEIDLANSANRNKLTTEQLISRLNELKKTRIEGGGQIGFGMQPQAPQPTQTGFSWQVPPEVQAQRDQGRIGILRQEKQQFPNDPMLAKELALAEVNIDKTPSTPQAINANDSPLVPSPPKRNGGITPGGPEYEAVMQALVDTPELRQKLLQGDQKLDSSEFQTLLKLIAAKEAASARGGAGKDPYMEWNKLSPQKRLAIMEWGKVQGINPITREPIKPGEQEAFDQMYAQDAALAAAPVQPKAGSIPIDQVTKGQVPVNEPPPINMRQSSGKVKLSPEERAALIAKIQGK